MVFGDLGNCIPKRRLVSILMNLPYGVRGSLLDACRRISDFHEAKPIGLGMYRTSQVWFA